MILGFLWKRYCNLADIAMFWGFLILPNKAISGSPPVVAGGLFRACWVFLLCFHACNLEISLEGLPLVNTSCNLLAVNFTKCNSALVGLFYFPILLTYVWLDGEKKTGFIKSLWKVPLKFR